MLVFDVRSSAESTRRCEFPGRDLTIGRDPACDLELPDANVSRFHAVIVLKESGEYVLRDVGSRNGLSVNGEAKFRHVLHPGDEIAIPPFTLAYRGQDAPSRRESGRSLPLRRKPGPQPGQPATTQTAGACRPLPTSVDALGIKWAGAADGWLLQSLKCAQVIASATSVPILASRLLESVLSSLHATRGAVLLREGLQYRCEAAQPEASAPGELSSRGVYGAAECRAPVLVSGEGEGADALCLPLVFEGAVIGVVCAEGAFRSASPVPGLDMAAALCGLCAAHVEHARERARLREQCSMLYQSVQASHRFVGSAPLLQDVYARINQAAQSDYPVLVMGETGTGKGLVARAIHQLSKRREKRFVALNCAAVPETLLESEMFGYAPHCGIANANPEGKPGKFEAADGGTLFLDEIGDFSPAMQAKLLRALEEQVVERLGSNDPVHVDVRTVAATNMNVQDMVAKGKFRADLYHRINCLQITLPPLRERPSDIPLLAAYFLEEHVPPPLGEQLQITSQTAKLLLTYPWPGNVRQLRYALLGASTRATAERLDPEHFDHEIAGFLGTGGPVKTLRQVVKEHIHKVLELADGNKRQAARLLEISPQTLHDKIKEHGIELPERTRDD